MRSPEGPELPRNKGMMDENLSLFYLYGASMETLFKHGSLNVPIEHHPTIRYMVYNGYYRVMSNIPKMGQLPTPVKMRKTLENVNLVGG